MTRPSIAAPLFIDPVVQSNELQRAEQQQRDMERRAAEAAAAERKRRNAAEFQRGEQKRAARAAKAAAHPEQALSAEQRAHPCPEDGAEMFGLSLGKLVDLIDDTLTAYVTPGAPSPSKRAFANLLRAARPHLEENR